MTINISIIVYFISETGTLFRSIVSQRNTLPASSVRSLFVFLKLIIVQSK